MNTEKIKTILGNKENALRFLEQKHPELLSQKGRQQSKKFHPEDHNNQSIYDVISTQATLCELQDFVFNEITTGTGKFAGIHRHTELAEQRLSEMEQQCEILKKKLNIETAVCMPDKFSDQIIKPKMREALKNFQSIEEQRESIERIKDLADLHYWERALAQLKGDLAEYTLLMNAKDHVIPTLRHQSGTDFYLIEDQKIVDLDIKTSKWPSFFEAGISPEKAIELLYANQGVNRFSDKARLYLIRPSSDDKFQSGCTLSLEEQLHTSYSIDFSYKPKAHRGNYSVDGCRIIFLDASKDFSQSNEEELIRRAA